VGCIAQNRGRDEKVSRKDLGAAVDAQLLDQQSQKRFAFCE